MVIDEEQFFLLRQFELQLHPFGELLTFDCPGRQFEYVQGLLVRFVLRAGILSATLDVLRDIGNPLVWS